MSAHDSTPIRVIGTGGHARVVHDLAIASGARVEAFIEPGDAEDCGDTLSSLLGISVERGYAGLRDGTIFAVGIGSNVFRRESFDAAVASGAHAATLIHPTASVETSASIGQGSQVCIGAVVCARASIGRGVIINSGAVVEHDCAIGAFAHICPGSVLAGSVTVGPGAMVGLGARVIQGITIGKDAVIGAGAVVLEDVAPGSTVVGVPAKPL